jgi:uncharacterized protein YjbI with pentapeptide repeats
MAQVIPEPLRRFYQDRINDQLIVAMIITVSFVVVAGFALTNGLGVGNKKAWDWLDVLVFPVGLTLGAAWYQKSEAKRDDQRRDDQEERDRVDAERQRERDIEREEAQRKREERIVEKNTESAALEAYLDQMSTLLVEKNLRWATPDSDVRALAQARTLTILLRVGPERKRNPLKLVAQMHLIDKDNCVIKLPHADLNDADLNEVTLVDVDLTNVDLRGADLTEANLRGTVLTDADLRGANLTRANLEKTVLTKADLRDTDLSKTNLTDADLRGANLTGANLTGADLTDADLRGGRYDAETLPPEGLDLEASGAVLIVNEEHQQEGY